ncbi:MAG: sigma-70 family RNA polymerase sigma factor [Ruminococcaceae bacterium]|nr:sigma-70 family RNA polymerase sigma factor [Oscillospiraceae bacterium]
MVETEREKFIVNNLGLVHSIANRFRNRGIDYDDLYQAGCVGLIKAADNFDETKGFAFSTYAVPVIMGEIKRLFRDDGTIKVSRSLKEKSLKVQKIKEKFLSNNFREPTINELAELSEIEVCELSEVLSILTPVQSLSVFYDDGEDNLDIPDDRGDEIIERMSIAEATDKLDESEKRLVKLRYYDGKTQTETAKMLGVSQVQVSRKEKRILLKLRELMK